MENRPTIEQLIKSKSGSYWLKDALRASLGRDLLDAYYDAQLLADMLKVRLDSLLATPQPPASGE